jgi:hypothetical protein
MNSDLSNQQMVSLHENNVVILNPKREMTKHEALVFASWIVALSDEKAEFLDILKAVCNSSGD